MMRRLRVGMSVLGAMLVAALSAPAVLAQSPTKNCYEEIGCPWKEEAKFDGLRKLSCDNLAHVRNRIYHENGFCFQTKANKELYGNSGCKFPIQQLVPLNRYEKGNVAKVRRVEREKGCKGTGG